MFQIKVVEKIKTHILCLIIFFFFKNLVFMRKCGENIVERDRPQTEIWHMRIEYWMPKATNTHTQVV